MKKLLLSMAMIAVGTAAFAQKPATGDFTVETQFGLNLGGPNGFTTPEIRARYFFADDMAARVRLNIQSNSTSKVIDNGSTTAKESGEINTSMFGFSIGIGAEKHLAGTEKLSPYFGAELMFSSMGATNTEATGSDNGTAWTAKDDSYKTEGGGTTGFGLSLLFGADYYFTNSIYLGGEMGWGFMSNSTAAQTYTKKTAGAEAKGELSGESSSFDMEMMNFPVAAVRFGVKF